MPEAEARVHEGSRALVSQVRPGADMLFVGATSSSVKDRGHLLFQEYLLHDDTQADHEIPEGITGPDAFPVGEAGGKCHPQQAQPVGAPVEPVWFARLCPPGHHALRRWVAKQR